MDHFPWFMNEKLMWNKGDILVESNLQVYRPLQVSSPAIFVFNQNTVKKWSDGFIKKIMNLPFFQSLIDIWKIELFPPLLLIYPSQRSSFILSVVFNFDRLISAIQFYVLLFEGQGLRLSSLMFNLTHLPLFCIFLWVQAISLNVKKLFEVDGFGAFR